MYPYYELGILYHNYGYHFCGYPLRLDFEKRNDFTSELKIGDIVEIQGDTAAIEAYGKEHDTYIINFIYEAEERKDVRHASELKFLYHDAVQERIFMGNALPPWNIEGYNVYEMLIHDLYSLKHKNDILPPQVINHIVHEHTVCCAGGKSDKIMADLNWSDRKFEKTCRQLDEHFRSIIKDYPADDIGPLSIK